MPEAKHYGDDLLDTCYLYTFDSKFTEGLKRELGHNAFDVKSLEIKPAHEAFALVKEQRSMVTDIRDEEMAFGAIFSYFKKGKLGYPLKVGDFAKNAKAMEAGGYSLAEDISGTAMSGAVAKLEEIVKSNGLSAVNYKIKLSTHAHGHLYHHSIALIGAKCELKYDEARRIIDKLFGEKNVAGKAFLNLSPKRLAAFVINNEAMLMEVFSKALSEELFAANAGSPVVEKDFRFPKKWDCTYDAVSKNSKVGAKNVYCGYPMSAGPRSTGEREFEKWCEQNQEVEWFYRNGDKGDEYFSIVYLGNAGQQKLFYPDYILSIGGKTWIIEVKGSFNKSGDSENIDRSAPKKAQALKAYCAKRGIRGGIACYDEGDGIFLLAEDGFSEDKNAECWETLDDAVAGA
jgi:type III restriction enzyme